MPYRYPTALRASLAIGLIVALSGAPPAPAIAQSTTSLVTDATVLPRGTVRLRGLTSFTRYDDLFGSGGVSPRPLGSEFSTDSLGVRQMPLLGGAEAGIRALATQPGFQLTAGKLVSVADTRITTAPVIAEYGVSSRLTIGLVVPFVFTRTTVLTQLNSAPGLANVGPNPSFTDQSIATSNGALVGQFRSASTQLANQIGVCQANPAAAGCAPIVSRIGEAQALVQASNAYATSLQNLYGTSQAAGQPVIPLNGGSAQTSINARIIEFNTQFRDFLGTSLITGSVSGAGGPPALQQFQALIADPRFGIARDTLSSPITRTSIGDISFGATYQLLNTFGDTSAAAAARTRYRLSVNGTFRIGSGEPADRNRLFDVGTGYGQPGIEGGAAADVQLRWLTTSVIGSYMVQIGSINVPRVENPGDAPFPLTPPVPGSYAPGNVAAFAIIPRARIAPYMAVNALYVFRHVGSDRYTPFAASSVPNAHLGLAAATQQQLGVGFSYSTVVSPLKGPGRLPVEVTYNHLETLTAGGGPTPKVFRDQIELRLYFDTLNRR